MNSTKIEWAQRVWNPVTGCTKVSPGCAHCYAERMAKRLQAMGVEKYSNGFKITLHPELLDEPLRWSTPQRIFVNSMSDLFHKDVPDGFILHAIDTMWNANWHVFLVLTKRAERMVRLIGRNVWPKHMWLGVSVENADYAYRIDLLRQLNVPRFVSFEPLLGPIPDLDLGEIDWVIVGGESGPGARLMEAEWVRAIRDTCVAAGVPFFFKQWGGVRRTQSGRILDGRVWEEYPQQMIEIPAYVNKCKAKGCNTGCASGAIDREQR